MSHGYLNFKLYKFAIIIDSYLKLNINYVFTIIAFSKGARVFSS